jgi:hypothetical protein
MTRRTRPIKGGWTQEDLRYLRSNAAFLPPDRLAVALSRSESAVIGMAQRRKIRLLPSGAEPDAMALERAARIIAPETRGKRS